MAVDVVDKEPMPKHTFAERAAANNLNDAEILNSNNSAGPDVPSDADVVIAGGGIHGLIYAIQSATVKSGNLSVSLIEKNSKPGYKIGESTLPAFSLWCKLHGLTADYLLRIFGLKDGLAFYFMRENDADNYGDNLIVGTPGEHLSGYQVERPVSELLFTLLAQRQGVNVYHGKKVDFVASDVQGGLHNSKISVVDAAKEATQPSASIDTSLLVDATGRFRQLASKKASLKRFEGFNTDAFWAYYTHPEDKRKMPFRGYEGCQTNHLCIPEGWFWVIRLLSWEGNSTAKMMDMLTYLLDCAEAGVPSDQLPCTAKLAEMFDLKYQWVTSVGVAARNDVKYPDDLAQYGSTEAERKLNYFIRKYPRINELMTNFELIQDLYGPKTTFFVRKTLTYQSPVVSGPGWLAIGDACGFTNPLYSPGINVGMASSTYAAELTHKALDDAKQGSIAAAESTIRKIFAPYDDFITNLIPSLDQMNRFNYLCFRDPRLGERVAIPWQYYASASVGFDPLHTQGTFTLDQEQFGRYAKNWLWGAQMPAYDAIARETVKLLSPFSLGEEVPGEVVQKVLDTSAKLMAASFAENPAKIIRWGGKVKSHDGMMRYQEGKTGRDHFTSQCAGCNCWTIRREDWTLCHFCGMKRQPADNVIQWEPATVMV
ncbi:uncharacterized protein B0I36DRAFT_374812 [Microdochium trichocladiopsis]|uniref:Uncharacterized protein n=1 Tax=Microdochium trichocladiopsis TaxID=1682393 RepID=A0A9P8Y3V3_9PEZI|nr:uncharacterized protein B0I36DRAFT_374812 [Microdochium trichocladiopsis]KAH7029238.1 hypothetical protein B0I36DRAFT_374812 [Microdochium trichocladiopsis]